MPQTSPINWMILTLPIMMTIMCMISSSNEKLNQMSMKMNFNLSIWSWKW